jgi:hypothetical protein
VPPGSRPGTRRPTLTWTKTQRTYRVELDRDTFEVLLEHRRAAQAGAAKAEVDFGEEAFVFSLRPDGAMPWKPD